ncbi:phosphotransferase family protein [Haliangium ochraceum]|uniref:Aminoglycoside phosphotransferase n=1 Tax=Haliangium ochraceum (strain DSM 14365 / JCM 11303 / SMP-2) TaxID=502025 RepID=D0LWV6_HALO1|nr:phosphotransferase family protein [Haliangium ochraceum]ACY14203.1 aminoglycoside phosphotransferase [Haliangium ochraceum DSM 14365]
MIDTRPQLRSRADEVPQDWPRLAAHLAQRGMRLSLSPPPRQFAGGLANLNYLLELDGAEAVLRRPPLGTLPPGAYNMEREFRILSRISSGFALAPRGLHLCEDPEVLGAPFQIVEFRRGFAVRAELPPALRGVPDIGARLAGTMIDVMVALHTLEPRAVGLDELGRPVGFLGRAVEGWAKRAELATEGARSPLIAELVSWLRAHQLEDGPASLIHNDLKLDNLLLRGDAADGGDAGDAGASGTEAAEQGDPLAPVALLDWDQCTRGDSLFDLATTLSYYTEPGDPEAMRRLRQMPSDQPGFPSRQQLAEDYARRTGRDLSDFRFYRVLAIFKLAIIFHQLHARYRTGATDDPRYAEFGALADGILDVAHRVARGELF